MVKYTCGHPAQNSRLRSTHQTGNGYWFVSLLAYCRERWHDNSFRTKLTYSNIASVRSVPWLKFSRVSTLTPKPNGVNWQRKILAHLSHPSFSLLLGRHGQAGPSHESKREGNNHHHQHHSTNQFLPITHQKPKPHTQPKPKPKPKPKTPWPKKYKINQL